MLHDLATKIPTVLKSFQIQGSCLVFKEITTGHIHRTFLGQWSEGWFIHQRFNHTVFPHIDGVTKNIHLILKHLKEKIATSSLPGEVLLDPILTHNGEALARDEEGFCWRTYRYIPNTESYSVCSDAQVAYEAGRMFGLFQARLSDLPPGALAEPIPHFMDCKRRLTALQEACRNDLHTRAASVTEEIAFVRKNEPLFELLSNKKDPGHQHRPTHGDMKLNNLLFDVATHKPIAVIDLDTCMEGSYLFDFGDMVRTACASAKEDEPDVSLVDIREDLFEGIVSGYAISMGAFLTPYEKAHLVDASRLLALTVGVRFLTDYLSGDAYFRISYPDHNLVRARSQFALARQIEAKQNALKVLVGRYLK